LRLMMMGCVFEARGRGGVIRGAFQLQHPRDGGFGPPRPRTMVLDGGDRRFSQSLSFCTRPRETYNMGGGLGWWGVVLSRPTILCEQKEWHPSLARSLGTWNTREPRKRIGAAVPSSRTKESFLSVFSPLALTRRSVNTRRGEGLGHHLPLVGTGVLLLKNAHAHNSGGDPGPRVYSVLRLALRERLASAVAASICERRSSSSSNLRWLR
jgi:hypothetical protein